MDKITDTQEESKYKILDSHLEELKIHIHQAVEHEIPAHEVEKGIFRKILKLGHDALGFFFEQQGMGDIGETLELHNGVEVRRLPETHSRYFQTILGSYWLSEVCDRWERNVRLAKIKSKISIASASICSKTKIV